MKKNSTYDFEITFNDILGDMEVIWMSDKISFDFKCLRKNLWKDKISKLDYDIMIELIDEFFYEFVEIRRNEFEKWFENY